ncbi:exodeoxyribonuclease V subunit beta [Desulfobacterales bacterium HSG2]|nr:exodeoxyribonuclease V subunit beta [Desulfobacterales bacterium HSG2]
MKRFKLSDSPLRGTNLIEASAGTGKTYTITGLFLRLILEKHLSIDKILVVTFTEAATEELKERIRSRLREASEAFASGQTEDKFLDTLIRKNGNRKEGLLRLEEAIRDFDEAAIFTIHGFCKRMLHENAFESGSLFDTELAADQEHLKREIVEDFWRKHFYDESRLFVNYILEKKISPETFLSLLRNKLSQPGLKIIPSPDLPDSSEEEKEYRAVFDEISKDWPSAKMAVENILAHDESLKRNRYRKTSVPGWIRKMDDYVAQGNNNPSIFKDFARFTSGLIKISLRKNCAAPEHPFFDLCEDLKEKHERLTADFENRLIRLKRDLFQYTKEELQKRKEMQNILSFDDLLINLHTALYDGQLSVVGGQLSVVGGQLPVAGGQWSVVGGQLPVAGGQLSVGGGRSALAQNIRTRFKAALIDEFQDTDPIQYDIFRTVFDTEETILFLIGDPKQAIYGFRGADIFTYMNAAEHANFRYTLGENWRSEPKLISAVNTVFENRYPAFVYDEIPFERVRAPKEKKKKDSVFLKTGGKSVPPLKLWFLEADDGKLIPKGAARKQISKAVAGEISRLLDTKNRNVLGKEPLREGDIAVLVRRNKDAELMQKELSLLKIPAVLHSTANIFDSHEALEMERVLSAIVQPGNERLLRTALATDMLGLSGEKLDALTRNETAYEEWLVKFREYHTTWNTSGFIQMFRQFISKDNVLPRLMAFFDGERRDTNLLHLSEILHRISVEKKSGMAWLVKWLAEQRDPNTQRIEEHQLRLESDENAVKLVTIHKSKGLEYPVVFCPFMYDSSEIGKNEFLFHDENDNRNLTLDLGSDTMEDNRNFAKRELLAENLRLLYVALTRAKHRCYLVWGRINKGETSAPAYLFHHFNGSRANGSRANGSRANGSRANGSGEDIVSATSANFKELSDADVLEDLKAILNKSGGSIRLSEMPEEAKQLSLPFSAPKDSLDCRKFSGRTEQNFRISSFSSLTSGRAHGAELADYDAQQPEHEIQEEPEAPAVQEKVPDIFLFPKGARTGIFMHDLFEHLDFTEKDPHITEQLAAEKLRAYNFDLRWQDAVCDMIQNVLSVPLEPGHDDFTLSRVRNDDRLNELEFYFPLNKISPGNLKEIFARYAGEGFPEDFPEYVGRLEFSPAEGFMKGFVDMVFQFRDKFYLVDWKSNFLGDSMEDYHQTALPEIMKESYYILQYHIYTVALHQYLLRRKQGYDYDADFGGVFYIFLRGMDPEKGSDFGIYRDRPAESLIRELCSKLIMVT